MLEQKLVGLRQPQIDAAQRIVVERPDAHHAQLRVVDVEHLHANDIDIIVVVDTHYVRGLNFALATSALRKCAPADRR